MTDDGRTRLPTTPEEILMAADSASHDSSPTWLAVLVKKLARAYRRQESILELCRKQDPVMVESARRLMGDIG